MNEQKNKHIYVITQVEHLYCQVVVDGLVLMKFMKLKPKVCLSSSVAASHKRHPRFTLPGAILS